MNPQLILIAAVARNGVIGKDNQLPWHLPEDLKHFKELTTGHAVIMGRKTWESLPERFRPLPGRLNIVVTRNPAYAAPGATVVTSVEDALKVGAGGTAEKLFVIGGAELYAHALPLAQRLELTEIDAEFEGDARFPAIDRAQWRAVTRVPGASAAGLGYAFVGYERVSPSGTSNEAGGSPRQ
jgi:dihydrofolate reductase